MNNIEEFESAYNTYMERDVGTPVEKFKHPVPGVTYKYQHANDMLAFWNAARAGLIAQLEAAQKERDEMNGILNIERGGSAFASKRTTHIDAMRDKWQARAKKAEAALSAASDKLSKPVVLPVGYAVRAGHPINEGERNVMIPKEGGNWLSRFDVEHAIRVAGFTVEGE
ncbi:MULTISPECIES: hypothetical protein [Yersinia]|uniref:hypothetical protein n=1 Tax=Yersinia TaxID=629 RepID=UPI000CF5DD1C|nr:MULTISPECIES: hypothetical protein [Yersinia]AVI44500.1 hypothetical protein A6J67_23390 [Yersinia sp. FDAARGOS_228]AVL35873.1 hypothetical protein CEQ36_09730 [Yersinia intermedia]